jgi:hypothetical protein
MGTPVRSAAMLLSTPTKGSPWTGARGALTPTRRAILGSPSLGTPSKKDSLIKVTFKQTHDAYETLPLLLALAQSLPCLLIRQSSLGTHDEAKTHDISQRCEDPTIVHFLLLCRLRILTRGFVAQCSPQELHVHHRLASLSW